MELVETDSFLSSSQILIATSNNPAFYLKLPICYCERGAALPFHVCLQAFSPPTRIDCWYARANDGITDERDSS